MPAPACTGAEGIPIGGLGWRRRRSTYDVLFIIYVIHAHAYAHTIEAKDPSLGA